MRHGLTAVHSNDGAGALRGDRGSAWTHYSEMADEGALPLRVFFTPDQAWLMPQPVPSTVRHCERYGLWHYNRASLLNGTRPTSPPTRTARPPARAMPPACSHATASSFSATARAARGRRVIQYSVAASRAESPALKCWRTTALR